MTKSKNKMSVFKIIYPAGTRLERVYSFVIHLK